MQMRKIIMKKIRYFDSKIDQYNHEKATKSGMIKLRDLKLKRRKLYDWLHTYLNGDKHAPYRKNNSR